MIQEVTVFRTSDGSTHRTRRIAEEHERYIVSKEDKKNAARTLMWQRWPELKTTQQSYEDGFESGLKWSPDWNHYPGGPWISGRDHSSDPVWIAYCEQTRKNNEAWRRGWKDGLVKQYEGRKLPAFFKG